MGLHVWTNDGDDFVIAASADDANAVMVEYGGSALDVDDWTQMLDDRPFTADIDDGNGPVKKTCGEWAQERGRGYFCTLNY